MGLNTLYIPANYPDGEVYGLLARQIKSYHRYYRMGDNTSVPVEMARELMESVQYTLALTEAGGSIDAAMTRGQAVLLQCLEECRELYRLVEATEVLRSQWRWETMAVLRRYLEQYDLLHFAHRIPDFLDYPLAVPVPQALKGIHWVHFYLHCLWLENQILNAFPSLDEEYPPDYWEAPENLCEVPLLRALGQRLSGDWSERAVRDAAEAVLTELDLPAGPRAYAAALMENQIPGMLSTKEQFWLF